MSRSVGDHQLHQCGVIDLPDFNDFTVDPDCLCIALVTESILCRLPKEKIANIIITNHKTKTAEMTANQIIKEAVERQNELT